MNEEDLRDVAALFAMNSLVKIWGGMQYDPKVMAEQAYELADAILEARKPKEEGIVAIKKRTRRKP